VLTVLTATSSQFTATYASGGFGNTSVTGQAWPVAYAIWLDNANGRNFLIAHESFRLEWTEVHITNTLSYSTIGSFNQRDLGQSPIDGLTYLTSTDSLFYAAPSGDFVLGGITDCGAVLCVAGNEWVEGIYGSGSSLTIDATGADGVLLQWEQTTECTVKNTFACAVPILTGFGTPASSSATCVQGQTEFDAAYLYTCVAANTWRRVATSSF
jgi:hypothetical protein